MLLNNLGLFCCVFWQAFRCLHTLKLVAILFAFLAISYNRGRYKPWCWSYWSLLCQKRFNLVNRRDKSYDCHNSKWLRKIVLRKLSKRGKSQKGLIELYHQSTIWLNELTIEMFVQQRLKIAKKSILSQSYSKYAKSWTNVGWKICKQE